MGVCVVSMGVISVSAVEASLFGQSIDASLVAGGVGESFDGGLIHDSF